MSQRDNNTIRYTLNGWRAWARGTTVRIDAFDLKPTQYGDLGTDDDVVDPARRFSGVTLGFVVPTTWLGKSSLYFDPFLWRRRNDVGAWGGRIGPAERFYAGARLSGDIGRWTIDWSANRQWGTYINQRIDAGQIFLAQTWRIAAKPTAPRIGVHVGLLQRWRGLWRRIVAQRLCPVRQQHLFQLSVVADPVEPDRGRAERHHFTHCEAACDGRSICWRGATTSATPCIAQRPAVRGHAERRDAKIADVIGCRRCGRSPRACRSPAATSIWPPGHR